MVELQLAAMRFPNKWVGKIFRIFPPTKNLAVPVKLSVKGVES